MFSARNDSQIVFPAHQKKHHSVVSVISKLGYGITGRSVPVDLLGIVPPKAASLPAASHQSRELGKYSVPATDQRYL
ncbi:hypothetical protein IF1G_05153 [Cordyceps javanica]|uniref:Uncharacterized protein n=1 Tax=Cordyceps javanica TaxID=43265 RepID=A0A545V4D3_9HYPO|nr:hypothetical protein IF1G_05153 [Cordyceps javanica]